MATKRFNPARLRGGDPRWDYVGSPATTVSIKAFFGDGSTPPPTVSKQKVWNGSEFVTGTLKVWNGSQWSSNLKRWTGTAWVAV